MSLDVVNKPCLKKSLETTKTYIDDKNVKLNKGINDLGTVVEGVVDSITSMESRITSVEKSLPSLHNSNLLDNSIWSVKGNIINQRGKNSYTGAGYTIDRWFLNDDPHGSLVINDGYIRLSNASEADRNLEFTYRTEELFLGKTITLSILLHDGSFYTATDKMPDSYNASDYPSGYVYLPNMRINIKYGLAFGASYHYGYFRIVMGIGAGITVDIVAIKLEIGEVQTLAHKEGNIWILNEAPQNPTIELLKCQRYYLQNNMLYTGRRMDPVVKQLAANVKFPVTMRARPAVTIVSRKGTLNCVSSYSNMADLEGNNATVNEVTISDAGFSTVNFETDLPGVIYSFRVIASADL